MSESAASPVGCHPVPPPGLPTVKRLFVDRPTLRCLQREGFPAVPADPTRQTAGASFGDILLQCRSAGLAEATTFNSVSWLSDLTRAHNGDSLQMIQRWPSLVLTN